MNIILVHGAYSDGNCWAKVTECLRDRGHNVKDVTLSGHSHDYGKAFDVTMEKYGEDIIKAAEKMDDRKSSFRNTFVTNEPIRPMFSKIKWTDGRLGKIPKIYVETLRDRMLTPKLQRYYMKRMNFECVRSIDSGHSPFFSKWEELCDMIGDECRKNKVS